MVMKGSVLLIDLRSSVNFRSCSDDSMFLPNMINPPGWIDFIREAVSGSNSVPGMPIRIN